MKARNQVSWLAIGLLALSFPGVSCGTSLAEIQLPVEQNKQSSSHFARGTDYDNESTDLIANVLDRNPSSLYRLIPSSGAYAGNATWERGQASN